MLHLAMSPRRRSQDGIKKFAILNFRNSSQVGDNSISRHDAVRYQGRKCSAIFIYSIVFSKWSLLCLSQWYIFQLRQFDPWCFVVRDIYSAIFKITVNFNNFCLRSAVVKSGKSAHILGSNHFSIPSENTKSVLEIEKMI